MAGKMLYKDTPGAGSPTGVNSKPQGDQSGNTPPMPTTPPAEGYQWQLQTGPNGQRKWVQLAIAAVGAIASYLSARQANKPRTGETDQTTTQSPYLSGMIQPDLEAILSYQRSLINQGPTYVGPQSTWPQYHAPQPGRAPGPVVPAIDYANLRPGDPIFGTPPPGEPRNRGARAPGSGGERNTGGPGGTTYGDSGDPNPEDYAKVGGAGNAGFGPRSSRGDLAYLRALFASTGRG